MTTRDVNRKNSEVSKAPNAMVEYEWQSAKVTLTGASVALTFKGMGLEDFADDQWIGHLSGEFASTAYIDESTITATGFTIVDGANTEVAHLSFHGKLASRA